MKQATSPSFQGGRHILMLWAITPAMRLPETPTRRH
jgi:hypothetical protein